MADIADQSQDWIDKELELRLKDHADKAAPFVVGKPGDCDFCGEWYGRLIDGACAPCRDHYKLK